MRTLPAISRPLFLVMALLGLALGQAATHAAEPMPTEHAADTARDIPAYTVTAPAGADTDRAYPVVLLMPPGPQTLEMAKGMTDSFAPTLARGGWVVISPRPTIAPGTVGPLLFETQSSELAGLVKHLDTWLKPEGGKYYAVGASNGGVSSVRFGLDFPGRTAAVLAFPGAMPPGVSKASVAKLSGVPLRLWVGARDTTQWLDAARFMRESITKYKLDGTVVTVQDNGHMIKSLTPEKVMDELSNLRAVSRGDIDLSDGQRQVLAVLDELHEAAASALTVGPAAFDRYFACFAADGVFIGTDATERWTVGQFKEYAKPLFAAKKGWKYTPKPGSRHVTLSADGRTAWFDEILENAKYGTCRGTGVLTRAAETLSKAGSPAQSDAAWLIAQYHLTMPVPNELAERVSKIIKSK